MWLFKKGWWHCKYDTALETQPASEDQWTALLCRRVFVGDKGPWHWRLPSPSVAATVVVVFGEACSSEGEKKGAACRTHWFLSAFDVFDWGMPVKQWSFFFSVQYPCLPSPPPPLLLALSLSSPLLSPSPPPPRLVVMIAPRLLSLPRVVSTRSSTPSRRSTTPARASVCSA